MKFPHFIRAAPFEFAVYGYALLSMTGYVVGLVINYYMDDVAVVRELAGMLVVLSIFGYISAFFAVGAAPVVLLIRRCIYPRKARFCIYEFTLHLIISGALMFAIWSLFESMVMVA